MSSAATAHASAPPAQRTAASGGGSPGPAIDPSKLLAKYFWLLAVAGVVGIGLGVGANVILGSVAPSYRSTTIYEVTPLNVRLGNINLGQLGPAQELQRFMQTEASAMTSDRILRAVLENPALAAQMPEYYEQFLEGTAFDIASALRDVKKRVSAAADSETAYIQMRVNAADPATAQQLGELLRRAYQDELRRKANSEIDERRKNLADAIANLQDEIERAQRRRERLIAEDDSVDALDVKISRAGQAMGQAVDDLADVQEGISVTQVNLSEYRAVLDDPSGISFPEEIRTLVDNQPSVQQVLQQIRQAELFDRQLEREGLGRNHPDRLRTRANIEAAEDQLAIVRERESRQMFDQRLEQLRLTLRQFSARQAELGDEIESLREQINELTRLGKEVRDIDFELENLQDRLASRQTDFEDIKYAASGGGAERVKVVQPPNRPDRRSFPKLLQMVPAGLFLVMGLTGGVIVLIELMDQRIKGPADVAMIPRTRVLGILPLTSDDPSRPECAETAYRDHPRGVFAEAVRQIRGPLLKRINQEGHRSLLVVPTTPGAGATTVATNLAEACSRADMRVLLVDANVRKPEIHKLYELNSGPGLVDVLVGASEPDAVIHKTDNGALDIMTVGSSEHRLFEGIASKAMGSLIQSLAMNYDLVIIDVAPAMVSGDAAGLASRVDATALVARALSEKRGLIARLKNELVEARGEFLGVIVNAVRPSAGGYFKANMMATHKYQNTADTDIDAA